MSRPFLFVLLVTVLALGPGCAAVVAGAAAAGTMSYVSNESARTYPATVEATWMATLEALREVGYPVDPSVPFGRDGSDFEVEDAKVQVRGGEQAGTTRVWVRVGTFDSAEHRQKAARILDAIGRRIGGKS